MKKKYVLMLAAIIIILAVVLGGYFASLPEKKEAKEESKAIERVEKTILAVDYGEKNVQTFSIDKRENATVLDILKESGLKIETKDYDFGVIIESINGKKNGDGGKYWLYSINGKTPMVSADKYLIKEGDKVEFKFEASPF